MGMSGDVIHHLYYHILERAETSPPSEEYGCNKYGQRDVTTTFAIINKPTTSSASEYMVKMADVTTIADVLRARRQHALPAPTTAQPTAEE